MLQLLKSLFGGKSEKKETGNSLSYWEKLLVPIDETYVSESIVGHFVNILEKLPVSHITEVDTANDVAEKLCNCLAQCTAKDAVLSVDILLSVVTLVVCVHTPYYQWTRESQYGWELLYQALKARRSVE